MSPSKQIRMPAEWEEHEATWLAWPYDKISFGSLNEPEGKPDRERLARVQKTFLQVISALSGSEQVNLIVRDTKQYPYILKYVGMFEVDYADVWTRDYMPSFLDDGTAVKWDYDAYGSKFPDLLKDNEVFSPSFIKEGEGGSSGDIEFVRPGIILEGGAIEVNGQGTLLTTEQCLLKRNPQMSKVDYENVFAKYLGISKVIWLKQGIVNDHTDGHIDDVARFVNENKVVCAWEENPNDPNFPILSSAYDTLSADFEVVKLPMPHMIYRNDQKAPASYANFYIANKVVLMPIYNDPNDERVLEIIRAQFPGRDIIPIDCSDLIYGGGAIHCAT